MDSSTIDLQGKGNFLCSSREVGYWPRCCSASNLNLVFVVFVLHWEIQKGDLYLLVPRQPCFPSPLSYTTPASSLAKQIPWHQLGNLHLIINHPEGPCRNLNNKLWQKVCQKQRVPPVYCYWPWIVQATDSLLLPSFISYRLERPRWMHVTFVASVLI